MLKSEVYLATISGFSPLEILVRSQIMIISLLWESLPQLARNRPSCENARHFKEVTGMVIIDRHLAVSYSHTRMMEFFPSWALARTVPLWFKSKQQIADECPKKNFFCWLFSMSMEIKVAPEVKMTADSL